jgi:hypothetical protein
MLVATNKSTAKNNYFSQYKNVTRTRPGHAKASSNYVLIIFQIAKRVKVRISQPQKQSYPLLTNLFARRVYIQQGLLKVTDITLFNSRLMSLDLG